MRIRVRPQDIEVPEDDPFENDLLDRREPVEVLTRLVGAVQGPSVLAVDAPWGNGKSTFVKIWKQHLKNSGFPVVAFNAWETDYSRDPFVALSSELTRGLTCTDTDESVGRQLEKVKKAVKEILRRSAPALVRIAAAQVGVNPSVGHELGQILASYAEERLAEYLETQKSVERFKSDLQDLAKTLTHLNNNRPLVIFIDELDRCRPSYAIELLEIAKHFFSVDHIVFVLAVNRAELAHSIKAFYGGDFDAMGYLRRFIDIDFRLPDPERGAFVRAMLANPGKGASSDRRKRQLLAAQKRAESLLLAFFSVPDFSLRRIAQAIHRLGLVLTLLPEDKHRYHLPVTAALILRTIEPEMYHKFIRGSTTDIDVVDSVFGRPEMKALQQSEDGVLFETMLIVATHEVWRLKNGWFDVQDQTISPLLKLYQDRILDPRYESDREHADNVIKCVEKHDDYIWAAQRGQSGGFRMAVQWLELTSYDLRDEQLD